MPTGSIASSLSLPFSVPPVVALLLGIALLILRIVFVHIRKQNKYGKLLPKNKEDLFTSIYQPDRKPGSIFKFQTQDGKEAHLYYELYGYDDPDSEKILFIPGLAVTVEWWYPQIQLFAKQQEALGLKKKYQICVIDNRGAGFRSSTPPGPWISTNTMARDAAELVFNHLGWKKVHLCGVSMGGMISQEFAVMYPDRIASLTLVSTSTLFLQHVKLHSLAFFIMQFFLALLCPDERPVYHYMAHMLSNRYLEELVDYAPMPSEINNNNPWSKKEFTRRRMTRREALIEEELYHALRRENPVGVVKQALGALTHYCSSKRLSVLRNVPIMIMSGTGDKVINHASSQSMFKSLQRMFNKDDDEDDDGNGSNSRSSRSSSIKLVLFGGAAHQINVECVDQFNKEYLDFVEQCPSSYKH